MQKLSEVAHQKERPTGHTVAVNNHVKMAQVGMSVEMMLGRRENAEMLYVD